MVSPAFRLDSGLLQQVADFRHDLHRHPELGYKETRTSEKVQTWLTALGIEFKAGLALGTGILGYLPATTNPATAPTIALRADMDALPIVEATGLDYSSVYPGVMHACGHDGHTSVLAGTAAALAKTAERPNNILFVFQPAEEGGAGGRRMVEDGVLTGKLLGKAADMIFGLHGYSSLDVGQVCTCDGPMLAATSNLNIRVKGVGGHAASPHVCVDPVVCASHIVVALQTIVSRGTDPLDSLVISVPMFHAGTAHNVIPVEVELTGTIRTLKDETQKFAWRRIEELVHGIAAGLGCTAEVDFGDDNYPVTLNDPVAAARFRSIVNKTEGVELMPDCLPIMGGEDFSFYGQSGVPACFYWLGLRVPGTDSYPNVHTPEFNFNDAALEVGIRAMLSLALEPL